MLQLVQNELRHEKGPFQKARFTEICHAPVDDHAGAWFGDARQVEELGVLPERHLARRLGGAKHDGDAVADLGHHLTLLGRGDQAQHPTVAHLRRGVAAVAQCHAHRLDQRTRVGVGEAEAASDLAHRLSRPIRRRRTASVP